jgi:hypothetical protein
LFSCNQAQIIGNRLRYLNGQPFTIKAVPVRQAGHSVSKVEYYDGATKIAEQTSGPYELLYAFNGSTASETHYIQVFAYDERGIRVSSKAAVVHAGSSIPHLPDVPANVVDVIQSAYDQILPGCYNEARATYWRDWFTHAGAKESDFMWTLQQNATESILLSCIGH